MSGNARERALCVFSLVEGPLLTCVYVTATKPLGYTFILGMDSIKALGGMTVDAQGEVRFNSDRSEMCEAADTVMEVDERDFYATYDPEANYWTNYWSPVSYRIEWRPTLCDKTKTTV